MREWLTFLAVVIGWALVGRLVLEMDVLPVWMLAIGWFLGLMWLLCWLTGTTRDFLYFLGIWAVVPAVGGAIALVIILLEWL